MVTNAPIKLLGKSLSTQGTIKSPLGAIKKALDDADGFVRKKEYTCLFPGCDAKAISSHSIQEALLSRAIAEKGKLYTIEQSFMPRSNRSPLEWYRDIAEIGIGKAGAFRGYCPLHDHRLFAPAESELPTKRSGMIEVPHMRGLSLHFSRQRRVADFFEKLASLLSDAENKKTCEEQAVGYKDEAAIFELLYLQRGVVRDFPTKQVSATTVSQFRGTWACLAVAVSGEI